MSEVKVINLTPHDLNIRCADGRVLTVPPSGIVARIEVSQVQTDSIVCQGYEIPIYSTRMGELVGLPDPEPATIFVTSLVVAKRARQLGRRDVFAPGELVRENGRVVGCVGLADPQEA